MKKIAFFTRSFREDRYGFTLVELIVVITILAILATIAFLSFQNYQKSARDSSRVSSLQNIFKGLKLSYIKNGSYPSPDNFLNIVGVSKQGLIGDTLKGIIKIGGSIKDPKDDVYYSYSLDYTGKKIQLSSFLEENNSPVFFSANTIFLNKSFASNVDYSNRYSYTIGDKVCVLLDSKNKSPINYNLTGSLNLQTDTNTFDALCSNQTNSGTISGSGQTLLTNISIIQNSCVLGNTVVNNGGIINAYNSNSVAYNQTCTSIQRTCNNGFWDGDNSYKYDTCSPAQALNCSATTYNGYSIPAINHNTTQNITKNITGGVTDINATCINGILSYGNENINCTTGYVLDAGVCQQDICTGNAPDFSVVNGIQKYNISWTHNISAGNCTFVCQAGYYYNNSLCNAASLGYYVASQGQISQTACSDNDKYQDSTGQSSCKTVSAGYYSTPIGAVPHTGQTQCEANNYCTSGVKTACSTGYSSPVGSSSAGACTINTYTVSGSFGANANGATINVCGTNVTADASGNFSTTRNYGSNCSNISATRTNYTCSTSTQGPASLASNTTNIAGSCTINTYTVSGSFGANANGATINVCGTNVTADTSGNFSTTRNYGSNCSNISATRTNYTCSTSTQGPASLASNTTNIAGSCTPNTRTFTCSGLPTNASRNTVSSYIQTWDGTAWLPANSAATYNTTASTTSCNYKCNSGYTWNGTNCVSSCPSSTISVLGYTYNTTSLGGKCWIIGPMKHGSMLASVTIIPSNINSIEKWCYNNDSNNCNNQGRLYSWYEAMGISSSDNTTTIENTSKSVCGQLGTGWHLPSNNDIGLLETAGATGWTGNKLLGLISSLPGIRSTSSYLNQNSIIYLWNNSVNPFDSSRAYFRRIQSLDATVTQYDYPKIQGHSVICVLN